MADRILMLMADGFDIHLEGERAERLAKAAEEAGVPVEAYALKLLDEGLSEGPEGWAEADAVYERYKRTGEYIGLDEALAQFRADLDTRLRAQGK